MSICPTVVSPMKGYDITMKTCFFAGHRKLELTERLDKALDEELRRLLRCGVTQFCTGGVRGWDMLCAMRILRLRESHPEIRLHMIIPCPSELYCAGWSLEEQFVYNAVNHGADSVQQLFEEYRFDCATWRNRRLAESSDICLSYFDISRGAGNTGQAVRFAEESDLVIINMWSRK